MRPIMIEKLRAMKYLKIEDNKAYFFQKKEANYLWVEIDRINKEDLYKKLLLFEYSSKKI